jgi:UV DNA damage endonuclease
MIARFGFVASVLSEDITTSRTCRLRNATPERLRELGRDNLAALGAVLDFLERHRIRLYRISSNVIPFASHPINRTAWWEDLAPAMHTLGVRLRALGVRVSTHPGQYAVLNSPNPAVVTASIEELAYHARLLDALGVDQASKIVVHIGGLYGGSEAAAMDVFVARASALSPEVLRRLVVENDDRLFDAEEALSVARRLGVPMVFDWLHHTANPCRRPIRDVVAETFATWTPADGRPKVHLSSQAAGGPPGAHADFVAPGDVEAFLAIAPDVPFDCMLEAKQKDRALLRLRRQLQARGIVELDRQPSPAAGTAATPSGGPRI